MKRGSSTISKIMLGASEVSKIYRDASLVYENSPPVVNIVIHGDSTAAQTYLLAEQRIDAYLQTELGEGYTVINVAVGGGALDLNFGDNRDLIDTAPARVDTLYDEAASLNIVFIITGFNDFSNGETPSTFRTKLNAYSAARQAVGWLVIPVLMGVSDYTNQYHAMRKYRLEVLEDLGATWAINFDGLVNPAGDAIIGTNADTHNPDLFDELLLHPMEDYNAVWVNWLAQAVRVLDGTATAPGVPYFTVKADNETDFIITRHDAPDSYPIDHYEIRNNEGAEIDIGLANPFTLDTLTAGSTNAIQMRAVDGNGNPSAWSSPITESTFSGDDDWTPEDFTGLVYHGTQLFQDDPPTVPADSEDEIITVFRNAANTKKFIASSGNEPQVALSVFGGADAIEFSANGKLIESTIAASLDGDWSVAGVIQTESTAGGVVLMWGDLATGERCSLTIVAFTGHLNFSGYNENINTLVYVADGEPHPFLVTKTGTLIKIWVDYEFIVSARPPLNAYTSADFALGGNSQNNDEQCAMTLAANLAIASEGAAGVDVHNFNEYLRKVVEGFPVPMDIDDDFVATNGTLIAGRTPSPVSNGNVWEVLEGGAVVNNNKLRGDNANPSVIVHQINNPNVRVRAVYSSGGNPFLVGRCSDNDNYFTVYFSGTQIRIFKKEAGAFTELPSAAYALSDNDVLEWRSNEDDEIEIWVNDVQRHSFTSSFNNMATKHGVRTIGGTEYDRITIVEN